MAVHRGRSSGEERERPLPDRGTGISFSVDASGMMRTVLRGVITAPQCVAHMEAREAQGLLDRPQIVDARGARLALSTEELRTIATLAKATRRRGPVGPTALVASDDLVYGIARMYEGFDPHGSMGFAVFRTIEEAEHWIWGVT